MARLARSAMLAAAALSVALVSAACSSSADSAQLAWPRVAGGPDAASFVQEGPTGELSPAWSRHFGVGAVAGFALSEQDQGNQLVRLAPGATDGPAAASACNLYTIQTDTGRKRWCANVDPAASALLSAANGTIYFGEPGVFSSFANGGQVRWHTVVDGTPVGSAFTENGDVLVVTDTGQAAVLDWRNGRTLTDPVRLTDLVPQLNGAAARTRLVRYPFAYDTARNQAVILADVGYAEAAPVLIALQYDAGARTLVSRWSTPTGPALSAPVLTPGGDRGYFVAATGPARSNLVAFSSDDGSELWRFGLDYESAARPSVTPDGIVIPAPARPDPSGASVLEAVDANGDAPTLRWRRDDVTPTTRSVVLGDGTAYVGTTAQIAGGAPAVVSFDVRSGEPIRRVELNGAVPVGLSVDGTERLLVTAGDGTLTALAGAV